MFSLFVKPVTKLFFSVQEEASICFRAFYFNCYVTGRVAGPAAATHQGCQMVCFQTKNSNLGKFLEGLRMENAGIFYGLWENFTVIWYILCVFGKVVVIFPRFGILCQEKSGNPATHVSKRSNRHD
jgi:hypothetical protein